MSVALIRKYDEERQSLSDMIETILGRADAEERDLVKTEIEQLEATKTRMAEIDSQLSVIKETVERQNSALDVQHLFAKTQVTREAAPSNVDIPGLGSFVDSDAYRAWDGVGKSARVELDYSPLDLLTRAPLTTGVAPGKNLLPEKQKYVVDQGTFGTPLLDVIGRLPISQNSIDLVTYGSPKGATGADVVAEGDTKPEGQIVTSVAPVTVETIAYYIQATRQLLQDAPAARSLIDSQLRVGLLHKLEAMCANEIDGGTFAATTGAAGQSLLEVARIGMATVQSAGFTPNAILCSPEAAADFDLFLLNKTLLGAVYGQGVFGLRIVPVTGLTGAYLGDFRTGIHLLERTGVDVFISDSHGDTFLKNVFTILAEVRAKTVVVQPAAITELIVTP